MVGGKLVLEEFVVTSTSTWAHTVRLISHLYIFVYQICFKLLDSRKELLYN